MASSGFSPRMRPEFTSVTPAARYQPLHFPQPSVVSVDPGGMRQRSDRAMASVLSSPTGVTTVSTRGRDAASSPAFHQYGWVPNAYFVLLLPPLIFSWCASMCLITSHKLTTKPVTFGHRPHVRCLHNLVVNMDTFVAHTIYHGTLYDSLLHECTTRYRIQSWLRHQDPQANLPTREPIP